jgi:hypothetical protein
MGLNPADMEGLYGKDGVPTPEAGGAAGLPAKVIPKHRLVQDPKHRKAAKERDRVHRQECVVCEERVDKGLPRYGSGESIPRSKWMCEACQSHYCVECFFRDKAHHVPSYLNDE